MLNPLDRMTTTNTLSNFNQWLYTTPTSARAIVLHGGSTGFSERLIWEISEYLNEYDDEGAGRWLAGTSGLVHQIAASPELRSLLGIADICPNCPPTSPCGIRKTLNALVSRGHVIVRLVFYLPKNKLEFILKWIVNLVIGSGLTLLAFGSPETPEIPIPKMINLGSASSFAVLAGSAITIAGASSSTTITGNIGIYPNPAGLAGMDSVVLNGINHGGDEVTQAAKTDLAAAYADAVSRSVDVALPAASDLLGLNLPAGVYSSTSSLFLSGILTLDGVGNPDSVWIFQMGTTLITAVDSKVSLINGAQASRVFWQVGSSATLATESEFSGNILAFTSIGVGSGVSVDGSLLAQDGAVTFDGNNIITVPEPGVSILLAFGLSTLCIYRRREPIQ